MTETYYFFQLDGRGQSSVHENVNISVEIPLRRILIRLDGKTRWSTVLGALPPGLKFRDAGRRDFHGSNFLQAGGSADRMILQVSRVDDDGECRMYNLGHAVPDESALPGEKVEHGGHWTKVYPEELWTAEQAISIFAYYFRNEQALPAGINLRFFDVDNAPTG